MSRGPVVACILFTAGFCFANDKISILINDTSTKFLRYYPNSGQLNNQVLSLLTAVCFAYKLNLTVAFDTIFHQIGSISHTGQYKVPFSTYYDEELAMKGLPVIFPTPEEYKEISKLPWAIYNPRRPPVIYPNPDAPYLTSPPISFHYVPPPSTLNKRVLNLHKIYFWLTLPTKRCQDDIEARFYNHVVPKQSIIDEARDWMAKNLKEPFAAIHYRRLDGKCKKNIGGVIDFIKEDLPKHNISSIFFATDMQDRKGDIEMKKTFTPKFFNKYAYHQGYKQGIMEQYIISRASVMYLNSESTFGWNAAMYNKFLHKLNSTVLYYTLRNGTFAC